MPAGLGNGVEAVGVGTFPPCIFLFGLPAFDGKFAPTRAVSPAREAPQNLDESTFMVISLRGLRGEPVRRLQEKLGVDADGIFGGGTEKAREGYQKENELKVDGIIGPNMPAKLELFKEPAAKEVLASVAKAGESAWDTLEEAAEGALAKVESIFGF